VDLPVGNVAGLNRLDVATGQMLGTEPQPPLPDLPEGALPLPILRNFLARALEGGNCYVSFSGGRDSTATLGLAADVARERGLPQPIPITMRFPAYSGKNEDEIQELVVSHLKLDDWIRLDFEDELELIGPIAQSAMLRHGLLFPASSHTMIPLGETIGRGRLVLGIGQGDFFSYWRLAKLSDVFLGKRRPTVRDAGLLAYALLPKAVRTAHAKRHPMLEMPWLRPEMAREARQATARRFTHGPLRCDHAIMVERTFRCHQGSLRCLKATSAETGTDIVVPYLDPDLQMAMVRTSGWRGRGSRGSVLRAQVGHLLPERALGRTDSTNFQRVLWGHRARAFAESWSGAGLDTEMVDPEVLRDEWLSDSPDFRTAGLLQLAWLSEAVAQQGIPEARTA
jgi:hypothetical protein